jgi:hypothetical protein
VTAAPARLRTPVNPGANAAIPKPGAAPRTEPVLTGAAKRQKPKREPSLRRVLFEQWLAKAKAGEEFVYHRGQLALDREYDPDLADLADRLQHLADARFDLTTRCGHIRGEIIGSGQVLLLTRRDRDDTVYFTRKR